jgi:adenylate cyclase
VGCSSPPASPRSLHSAPTRGSCASWHGITHQVRAVLWLILAAWAIASLARVPLLDRPLPPDAVPLPLGLLALVGVVLYGIAAVRYAELYRRRRRPLPLAVLVAFILMAEAMIAVAFSRTWHAMWWEWHVLMAVAFGAILVAARVEYRREGSLGAVFAGIYLDSTLRRRTRARRSSGMSGPTSSAASR